MTTHHLLHHFAPITEAPAAVARLRQLVLDLAVRGKLVAQEPREGTGADLLSNIRKMKNELMIERGIHREKEIEYSEPENEFEIPSTWAWVYVDDVAIIQGGKRLPEGTTFSKIETPHIYIRVTDMKNGTIMAEELVYISPEVQRSIARYIINKEDLYITIAGTIGQVGRVPPMFDGHNLTENAAKIVFRGVNTEFLRMVLSSDFLQQQFRDKTKQMAQPKLALKRIAGAKFPLPPLAEQQRIVAKVDELMTLCDELAAAQSEREARRDRLVAATLHRLAASAADPAPFPERARFYFTHLPRLTTRPEHIHQLRQTILNLAVQGKLVLQDPHDEPASELLKQIQVEKSKFKLGRSSAKEEWQPVEVDTVLFEIPPGYQWVRLEQVITLLSGQHLQPGEYNEDGVGIPYITGPADFGQGKLSISRHTILRKSVAIQGNILLTVKGAGVGKATFCDLAEVAISRQLMALQAIGWNQKYLMLIVFQLAEALKNAMRSLIPGISREDVLSFMFPLPPLAEQQRIVARVDELLALCDELAANLDTVTATRRRLLEAALQEALVAASGERALHGSGDPASK
jgi:type I restriction enzyme S subunit